MLQVKPLLYFPALLLLAGVTSCATRNVDTPDYLLKVCNSSYEYCGYIDMKGDTVIHTGKYAFCFTDTFRSYAIVVKGKDGFSAIDREEKVLYQVFAFDNGPDEPSDGLFRIQHDDKIGYADAITGKIVIQPQFSCGWPFEEGVAKVSMNCTSVADGEHTGWTSEDWYFIDRRGKKVNGKE